MTKGLRAAHCVSSASRTAPHSSIWISDALLADSFNHFTRGSRRNGSHIPGPLEARRRATKRRNTNLAYAGAGTGEIEAGVLFRSGIEHGWWTDMKTPVKIGASRILPSWLTPLTLPTIPAVLELELEPTQDNFEMQSVNFRTELQKIRKLDEMRLVITRLHLDIVHDPRYSEIAFNHMLDNTWAKDDVASFLEDPSLNQVGTRNIVVMMQKFCTDEYAFPTRARNSLFRAICKSISLGLVSPDHIRHIIEVLPNVRVEDQGQDDKLRGDRLHLSYYRVVESVRQSSVISLADLGPDLWSKFVMGQLETSFSPTKAKLLLALRPYAAGSQLKFLTKITMDHLSGSFTDSNRVTENQCDRTTHLLRFLRSLNLEDLVHVLFNTTETLITAIKNSSCEAHSLKLWGDILARFKKSTLDSIFDYKPDVPSNPSPSLNSAERLLAFSWTMVNLCASHQKRVLLLNRLELRLKFEEAFNFGKQSSTRDALARVLTVLQTLPLSNKCLLLSRLRYITGDYLVARGKTEELEAVVQSLLGCEYARLAENSFYYKAKRNLNDALAESAECVNKDLAKFLQLSRALIATDKYTFKTITRILKHNLPIKLALSQSSPQRLQVYEEWVKLQNLGVQAFDNQSSEPESKVTISPSIPFTPAPRVTPEATLQLINHLAMSFATTTAVEPLSAFRKVYWCYLYLHAYGAPVQPEITRALWHAGVTRFQKRGVCVNRFKWILSKVREVEGEAAARMLLLSVGYRAERQRELESLGYEPSPIVGTRSLDSFLHGIEPNIYWSSGEDGSSGFVRGLLEDGDSASDYDTVGENNEPESESRRVENASSSKSLTTAPRSGDSRKSDLNPESRQRRTRSLLEARQVTSSKESTSKEGSVGKFRRVKATILRSKKQGLASTQEKALGTRASDATSARRNPAVSLQKRCQIRKLSRNPHRFLEDQQLSQAVTPPQGTKWIRL